MLLFGRFLRLHGVHCGVNLVTVGVLNTADWHTVVNTSLVNGCGERVLGQLQLCSEDEGVGVLVIRLTRVLEQLPHLFGATRASFYSEQNRPSHEQRGGQLLVVSSA